MIKIEFVNFMGWERCVRLSNGIVDLIATTEVGPRIVRFGFEGGQNELALDRAACGLKGGDEFRLYGGHRLWHSPEDRRRTYLPDNEPVDFLEIEGGIRLIQKPEALAHTQKQIDILMDEKESRVKLIHRITNLGLWPVELSAWAITILDAGGIEIIPQPARDTDLLPNRRIALWPYSRMNDERVHWGERYVIIKQNPGIKRPFKLGINNEAGWAAYGRGGHLFFKKYRHDPEATYPDFGVSYETYTTDWMLEMETLSPFVKLQPGEGVEHVEEWELYDGVKLEEIDEGGIDEIIEKTLNKCMEESL